MTVDISRPNPADTDTALWTAEMRPHRSPWEDPKLAYQTTPAHLLGLVIRVVIAMAAAGLDAAIMIPMLDRAFGSDTVTSTVVAVGLAVLATTAAFVAGWEARGAVAGHHRPIAATFSVALLLIAIGAGGLVMGLRLSTSHGPAAATAQFEDATTPTNSTDGVGATGLSAALFLAVYLLGITIAVIDGYSSRNDAYSGMVRAQRMRERLEPLIAEKKGVVLQLSRTLTMVDATLRSLHQRADQAKAANKAAEEHLMEQSRVVQASLLGRPDTAGITTTGPSQPTVVQSGTSEQPDAQEATP